MNRRAFLKGAVAGAAAAAVGPSLGCMPAAVPPSDNVIAVPPSDDVMAEPFPNMTGYFAQLALWPNLTRLPDGWLPCDGQRLPIAENIVLFSLLSTRFGGDGVSEFGLPRLVAPVQNMQYLICNDGIYPPREDGGLFDTGRIILTATEFTVGGCLPCDGSLVETARYPELGRAMGYNPARSLFALPKLDSPRDGLAFYIQYTPDVPDQNPLIGEIGWFPTGKRPADWLPCIGQIVTTRQSNVDAQALALVLENKFGGNIEQDGTQGLPTLATVDIVVPRIRANNGQI